LVFGDGGTSRQDEPPRVRKNTDFAGEQILAREEAKVRERSVPFGSFSRCLIQAVLPALPAIWRGIWLASLFSLGCLATDMPKPTTTSSLKELGAISGDSAGSATVVFVSDSRVAVLACEGIERSTPCRLSVIDYKSGALTKVCHTDLVAGPGRELFVLGGGRLLVNKVSRRKVTIFSADLARSTDLSMILVRGRSGSNVIGDYDLDAWKLYRVSDLQRVLVREGPGELKSVSNSLIVFRKGDVLAAESLDGRRSKEMTVPAKSVCGSIRAEPAGLEHLYVDGCGREGAIRDLEWRMVRSVAEPEGWGVRHGWTLDGSRVLFDHYTRTISFLERALETAIALLSLGLGVADQPANGERIQVVDTRSGGVCFDWASPLRPLGPAGEFHADISPSGRLVAAVAWGNLMIYKLPKTCD